MTKDAQLNIGRGATSYRKHRPVILMGILMFFLHGCSDPLPEENEPFSFTDPRDGQSYLALEIGEQTWMVENLSYHGTLSDPSAGGYQEPFYYMPDSQYGVLYNWRAAMGACPDGWHLPGDDDWQALEAFLSMEASELTETGWRTSGDVGFQLKSVSGWEMDGNGNNASGFNVSPGGLRTPGGIYGEVGAAAYFWSASAGGSSNNFGRKLQAENKGIYRNTYSHNYGLGVRCIRDE